MVKKRKKKKRWKLILLSEPLEGTSPPDNLTFCCCSVAQLCPTLCDPMYCNQASLSFTISQRLLKLTSIKLMMPSHHLILCHLWPLDAKSWLIGKDADAGKDWRQKERGWQRKRWTRICPSPSQWTWIWANSRKENTKANILRKHISQKEIVEDRGAWRAAVHGFAKNWAWLCNWTTVRHC